MGRHHPHPRGQPQQVATGAIKRPDHVQRVTAALLSFTDSNIYYQKYSTFDTVNFYRESLFQIIPPSNFDIHDEMINNPNMTR